MNIDNLEAFVFINHFGSVNKAAKALFLTQPSVTSRIQSLERGLDVELFERVGRKLILTDAGKEFLPYADSIIQTYKNGKKWLEARGATDQIVIGSTGLVSNYLIPLILPKFRQVYPNIQIKLMTDSSEVIESKVRNREVDLGFIRASSQISSNSTKVFKSPVRLFVKQSHPFVQMDNVGMEELAKQPIVFFEYGLLDWTMIKNQFKNLDHLPNIAYEVDNLETAKGLILNGAGIGFLPEICVRKEVASGELIMVNKPVVPHVSLQSKMIYYREDKPAYFDDLFKLAQSEEENVIQSV